MRRCIPGRSDLRCKIQEKHASQFSYLFDQPQEAPSPITVQDSRPNDSVPVRLPSSEQPSQQAPKEPKKLLTPAPIAKSTQKSLTDEQLTKAKLTRASDILHEDGLDEAKQFLIDEKIDYEIDPLLSNDSGLVLINNETGKAVVAYRGTDITSPADWLTALSIFKNQQGDDRVFIDAKKQLNDVIAEYGQPEELVGFSRGGSVAMTLGNEFNVDTTTFNPFVNKDLAFTLTSDATHNIVRTTTDPVSIGSNVPNPKFKVTQLDPLSDSINPITNHALKQFLSNDSPRRTAPLDNLQNFVQSTGKAQSELITMKDMSKAVKDGKSFTEFLSEFSPVDFRDGQLSNRIYEGSNFTDWWKDAGGSFEPFEKFQLSQQTVGTKSETSTTSQHRQEFSKLAPSEQDVEIQKMTDLHINALEKMNGLQSGETDIQSIFDQTKLSPNISETASKMLAENLSGASIGSGLIGAYLGNKIVSELDPNQALKVQGDEALSGFLGGGIGAVLGGGAVLPAAIAGSAGLLAGAETTRALEKQGVGEVGASTVGGTVGGATAGLAAATIGAGSAALAGAEIGSAFAPETFGLSVAVGAAVGGLFGLGASLWDKAFGDEPTPPPPPEEARPYDPGRFVSAGTLVRPPVSAPPPVQAPPPPQAPPPINSQP